MSSSTDIDSAGLRVSLEANASRADQDFVIAQLAALVAQQFKPIDLIPLSIFLRDQDGNIQGGLLGSTQWSLLHIDTLWVAAAFQKQGHGSRLLAAAEKAGRIRGCTVASVETQSFQACGFYEKAGYQLYGTLHGMQHGLEQHCLSKLL